MNLFKKIVDESILTEMKSENDDSIIDAINKVLRVRIAYYDGDKGYVAKYGESIPTVGPEKGKHERYILPVAYGLTKSGKRAIRAYQSAGSTRRGVPHWKLFLLDNIVYWSNGKRSFKDFGKTLIDLGLNTNGDKGLTTLFAITPIANNDVQVVKNDNPIDDTPVSKNDVTPSTSSQNPNLSDKNKFISAQTKRQSNIDNIENNDYSPNRVEAPPTQPILKQQSSQNNVNGDDNKIYGGETTPVLKQNITTNKPVKRHNLRGINGQYVKSPYNFASDKRQFDINSPEWQEEYSKAQNSITNGPITKQEVDMESEKKEIAENFKKMLDRMNNSYNYLNK